jgi:amidase
MSDLTRLSATKVLALLKNGTLSVEQYARSLLARIDQRDDVVQAWAFLDPDLIISAARRLDKIPLENRGPIHGLPIGIKDVALTLGI